MKELFPAGHSDETEVYIVSMGSLPSKRKGWGESFSKISPRADMSEGYTRFSYTKFISTETECGTNTACPSVVCVSASLRF